MRSRTLARIAVLTQAIVLAGALVVPSAAAAATLNFTLNTPTLSSVQYSDFDVLRGTYICVNDVSSVCSNSIQSDSATFSIRPAGGDTFTDVGTVSSSFNFTGSAGGCPTTCTFNFQLTWKAGRASGATVAPGVYDIGLTSSIGAGQLVLLNAVTVGPESTTTTYGGLTAGLGDDSLALSAAVVDQDLGQASGTGIFAPDANLFGANEVTFELFDATNTTSVVGPVSATLLSSGLTTGSPSLVLPAAGGTYKLRTTFVGNDFYTTSSELDTITVTPSNTAPVLIVPSSPVSAEATSAAGAAVMYSVSATDAEDNPAPTPTCAPASGSVFPIGDTTVNCSVTDSGWLTDTGSFTVHVADTTDPTVGVSTAESDNGAGWYNIASNDGTPGVTVDVSTSDFVGVTSLVCTDNGADVGALNPSGDSFVIGDGAHAIACTATDAATNHASDDATFDVDQAVPTISASLSPDADGSTGWWNASTGAPTVTYTCADGGSGVASCSPPSLFGEGAGQSALGTATDVAGNSSSTSVAGIAVDLTAPIGLAFVGGGLVNGGSYVFGSVPAGPTGCTGTDLGSGLSSCDVSGYSTAVSAHIVVAEAVDNAGNVASIGLSYTVLPWTFVGFANPISMTSSNSVKSGSTANLRFQVFAGTTEMTSLDAIAAFTQTQVSCATLASIGPTTSALLGKGASLKYSTQFQAKWDPPAQPNTCWTVAIVTADGSSLQATFQLK